MLPKPWIGAMIGLAIVPFCLMIALLLLFIGLQVGFTDWRLIAVVVVLTIMCAAAGYRLGRHLEE